MRSNNRKNINLARIFFSEDMNFNNSFSDFLSLRRRKSDDIISTVSTTLKRVKSDGDSALIDYTLKLDNFDLVKNGFSFTENEIKSSKNLITEDEKKAIELAIDRISLFHKKQAPFLY